MKKTIVIVCACAATLLLTECAKKTSVSHNKTKKQTPEEQLAEVKTKYTAEQIAQGKVTFTTKCGECHELKQPGEFTIKQWNKILPDMIHKARIKDPESGILNAWIITNAKGA